MTWLRAGREDYRRERCRPAQGDDRTMIDSDQFQPKYLHLERIDDILVATIRGAYQWVTEEKVQEIGDEIYAAIEHATEKSLLLDFCF